ncbi:diguanylate cyclase [Paenibacillus sp. MZ04-78.2]|uniref:diguanylate cyclase domain-containing protein n=1 Tax=Paenibacillus sp. MZ04-78.2 TaxID=2962034 RepID=UPI0020B7B7B3|nr:diguanylate cyclase [Paenibacillus sp. MZ04-78.2]MCP3774948.1 diguanylate cyclase [Paenibacillus sp. MZ04-78.2]
MFHLSHVLGRIRNRWFAVASFVTGSVWSTYVAVLVFHLDDNVRYDTTLTFISLLAGIMTTFLIFHLALFGNKSRFRLAGGGLLTMIGMATMYITGSEAVIAPDNDRSSLVHSVLRPVDLFLLFGVLAAMCLVYIVVWQAMRLQRQALEKLAYTDPLTGLLNRNAWDRYAEKNAVNRNTAFLFLDLDGFKSVNDTLGHDIGDLLIGEAGQRLKTFQNKHQHIFRLGGDEFLLVALQSSEASAKKMARDMLETIKVPYRLAGNVLYVSGSIGICFCSDPGSSCNVMLKKADAAMYRAKLSGRNRFCTYREGMSHFFLNLSRGTGKGLPKSISRGKGA